MQIILPNPEQTAKQATSCAITGHRTLPPDFDESRVEEFLRTMMDNGITDFYNGLAMGFDLLTAELIVKLKKDYPSVRLHGCIPFYGQERYYPETDKSRYTEAVKSCDSVTIIDESYHRNSYFKRNDYMVERADLLFAYCKEEKGGAAYTIKRFQKTHSEENLILFNE